jgi:hypothetical protein
MMKIPQALGYTVVVDLTVDIPRATAEVRLMLFGCFGAVRAETCRYALNSINLMSS